MSIWLIIAIVLAVLVAGGMIARLMWLRRTEAHFRELLHKANRDLAQAAAEDRGWDRERMERVAREVCVEQKREEPSELLLVEVLDRPGTDEDLAVFRCAIEGGHHRVTLGRRGAEWVLERFE